MIHVAVDDSKTEAKISYCTDYNKEWVFKEDFKVLRFRADVTVPKPRDCHPKWTSNSTWLA